MWPCIQKIYYAQFFSRRNTKSNVHLPGGRSGIIRLAGGCVGTEEDGGKGVAPAVKDNSGMTVM